LRGFETPLLSAAPAVFIEVFWARLFRERSFKS
jgi:hypothetical protein